MVTINRARKSSPSAPAQIPYHFAPRIAKSAATNPITASATTTGQIFWTAQAVPNSDRPPSQIPSGKKSGAVFECGFLLINSGVMNAKSNTVTSAQLRKSTNGAPSRLAAAPLAPKTSNASPASQKARRQSRTPRPAPPPGRSAGSRKSGLSPRAQNQPRHAARVQDRHRPDQGHRPGQQIKNFRARLFPENHRAEGNAGSGVKGGNTATG